MTVLCSKGYVSSRGIVCAKERGFLEIKVGSSDSFLAIHSERGLVFVLRNAFRRLKSVNKWSCAALLHVPCLIQFMFIIYAGSEKMLLDLNGDSDWNLVICDPCFLHPVAVTMHHHPFSCGFLTLYCTCHPISLKYHLGADIIISLGRETKLLIR